MDNKKKSGTINNSSNCLLDSDIQSSYLKSLNSHINTLKEYYEKYIKNQEESLQNKINSIFSEMNSIINLLSKEKDNFFYQYESSLQKNESKIRALYSDIFNLNVKKSYLENNMEILLKKEKEYRLVKEKTGVVVENGTIVYNDRKENEIFILRTENSTLKNVITKKEKELEELKEKYENEKENNEKIMSKLNSKFNRIKYKLNIRNPSIKGKSNSTININSNNIKRPNLKLNYTINNSSINKVKNSCNTLTSRLNNNNNSNNSNDLNKKKFQKQIDFSTLTKKEKKYRRNNNVEGTKTSLVSCHSTGLLNLKSNVMNKLNKAKQKEAINQKIINQGLNLSHATDLTKKNKKTLYLTPKNNSKDKQEKSNQTYRKIGDIKKNDKANIVNKNKNIAKKNNTNQTLNDNNNYKDIRILFKNNMKNKSTRNNKIIGKEQKTTLNQNHMVSILHNSPFRIRKVVIKNNNSKNKKNICNINKLSKIMNENNTLKNYKSIIINNKIKVNETSISKKENEKNNSKVNKFSLTSIRRKNINNSLLKEYKTDLIDYNKGK